MNASKIGKFIAFMLAVGTVYVGFAHATSPWKDDFTDSLLYWPGGFLLFPLLGGWAGFRYPHLSQAWFGILGVPFAISVVLFGAILYEGERGASLWAVGLLFVIGFAGLAIGGGAIGQALRSRRGRTTPE